jgi:hypothetical protein
MQEVETITQILLVHWFADFVLQTDQMAQNKSHSIKWLSIHVLVYTIPLLVFGVKFALVNGGVHFIVDYFTSKISKRLYLKSDIHNFFVVVGLDQYLHTAFLIWSYFALYPHY